MPIPKRSPAAKLGGLRVEREDPDMKILSQNLASLLGGRIIFQSEYGRGSNTTPKPHQTEAREKIYGRNPKVAPEGQLKGRLTDYVLDLKLLNAQMTELV